MNVPRSATPEYLPLKLILAPRNTWELPFLKKFGKLVVLQITRTNTWPVNIGPPRPSTFVERIKATRQDTLDPSPVLNPNTCAPWKGWFICTRLQIFTEQRGCKRKFLEREREGEQDGERKVKEWLITINRQAGGPRSKS